MTSIQPPLAKLPSCQASGLLKTASGARIGGTVVGATDALTPDQPCLHTLDGGEVEMAADGHHQIVVPDALACAGDDRAGLGIELGGIGLDPVHLPGDVIRIAGQDLVALVDMNPAAVEMVRRAPSSQRLSLAAVVMPPAPAPTSSKPWMCRLRW